LYISENPSGRTALRDVSSHSTVPAIQLLSVTFCPTPFPVFNEKKKSKLPFLDHQQQSTEFYNRRKKKKSSAGVQ